MSEYTKLFERAIAHYEASLSTDGLLLRRDRKRRNQRITAGVVGLAVFVAATWIATAGGWIDRTEAPAVPGGGETGPKVAEPIGAVGPVPRSDYLLDLNTGETTPLPDSIVGTDNDATGGYAASPDGSRLAYEAPGNNGKSQLFVANLDGTGIEQVTHDLEAAYSPVWSLDGSKIAYTGHQGNDPDNVFVLDVTTGTSTQLTFETWERVASPSRYGWLASTPSFTPDGSSIVYNAGRWDSVRGLGFEHEVRIVPVAGGGSVRLMGGQTDGGHAMGNARLSPDGSLLLYSCRGYSALCVAHVDGTDERVLMADYDAINGTSWSPDGTRVPYFTFHAQNVVILDVASGRTSYVAEGSSPTWLDDHTLIIEISQRCYNRAKRAWGMEGCPG
jgi:Tol biopolymer transport system component